MIKSNLLKYVFFSLSLFTIISCKAKEDDAFDQDKLYYEMSKLSSQTELDALIVKGNDNIVDWQLSREFAELWLQESIDAGEYPVNSSLWDIPVAVYDTNENIKYYEFRVTYENKVIAYIVGAATKDFSSPIVYQTFCKNGYADDISELYYSGKLNANELPRIVDNGYPNVVFGVIQENSVENVNFDYFVKPETGETVEVEEIESLANYEELKEIYPELFEDTISSEKLEELISNYESEGEQFWELAVANKGHIGDFAVRGSSKRTELSSEYVKNVTKRNGNQIANYGACGPVADGFVLDYLQYNYTVKDSWSSKNSDEKRKSLYTLLKTGNNAIAGIVNLVGEDGSSVTLPENIGNAISAHSKYKVSLSTYNYPKYSIESNLPGISLRTFGDGGMHYRPVIAYKKNGWGPFSWPSFKILDLVDCDDKEKGMWETYIPVHHIMNWNVVKK